MKGLGIARLLLIPRRENALARKKMLEVRA
jgi:hypothetical protein